jgi:hypothetical protein
MPATVTLSTTTLTAPVDEHQGIVSLASTSGVIAGRRLYVDGEVMTVLALLTSPLVKVIRGVDGTRGAAHPPSATVYIAEPHQLYTKDPVGAPPNAVAVSPWINVIKGKLWFAQGDNAASNLPIGTPPGDFQTVRWWQEMTTTHGDGALGVSTTTLDPTSST